MIEVDPSQRYEQVASELVRTLAIIWVGVLTTIIVSSTQPKSSVTVIEYVPPHKFDTIELVPITVDELSSHEYV